jgi:hypothetical protein
MGKALQKPNLSLFRPARLTFRHPERRNKNLRKK